MLTGFLVDSGRKTSLVVTKELSGKEAFALLEAGFEFEPRSDGWQVKTYVEREDAVSDALAYGIELLDNKLASS